MPKNTTSVQEKGKRAAMQTAKRIFVNLPVSDLSSSVDFFTELGFAFDDQFTGDHASCMIIGENIFAMLLPEKFFKKFIPGKEIADSTKSAEVVVALSVDCRKDVDRTISKASPPAAANAETPPMPAGCMAAPSRTWTATSGKSSPSMPARWRKK